MEPIKLIIVNGCSYTRGAELIDPRSESWPAVLEREVNIPVVNLASDGGSNRRIVRTVVANFDRVKEDFSVAASDILVMCMWTGLARFEYRRQFGQDKGKRPRLPDENRWHRLGRWRIEEGDAASESYFRYLWDERGAAVNFFLDWLLLDSYLRARGAETRYVYAWNTLPSRLPREALALRSQIDVTKTYGNSGAPAEHSFFGEIEGRYPVGKGRHPLAAGHSYFAHRLAEWLGRTSLNNSL